MNAVCTRSRRFLSALVLLLAAAALPAQSTRPPTAAEVKALLAKYQAEHDAVVKQGIAQRFQPALMERAEALAAKGARRWRPGDWRRQPRRCGRRRWQLPYQAPGTPTEHVARIIGMPVCGTGRQSIPSRSAPTASASPPPARTRRSSSGMSATAVSC